MSAEFFLDTNVLVYTFDRQELEKKKRATELVERALASGRGVLSTQVVQEFLHVALQKFEKRLSFDEATQYLRVVLDPLCDVFPSLALYERALSVQDRWRFAFYDSLIVAAALEAGCEVLFSEDLQHAQRVEALTIVNPFVSE